MHSGSSAVAAYVVTPFREGMRELGYVEGKRFVLEDRYADGDAERLPVLAAELVRLKVNLIVAYGPHAIRAAQRATSVIPVVMGIVHEPVALGFVASLARPGANITGLAFQDSELATKRLELLQGTVPALARVAALWDPGGGGQQARAAVEQAARAQGVLIQILETVKPGDIDAAFEAARRDGAQAVIQLASPLHAVHRTRVGELALKYRLPTSCETMQFVQAGCFMSYGPSFPEMSRRAATYVDRILKGARPGELPVEQPTKFELAVNLKTASILGLTIPQSLLLRADYIVR